MRVRLLLLTLVLFFAISCDEDSEANKTNECTQNSCIESNKTICSIDNNKVICSCENGYYLDDNQNCVLNTIICEDDSCSQPNKTICSVENNQIVCACDAGYYEEGYECIIIPICDNSSCTELNKTVCSVENNQIVCACDIGYHKDGENCVINVVSDTTAPEFSSNNNISIPENQTNVTTIVAIDESTVIYTITNGADQSKFSIDSNSGLLTFNMAPDYEIPTDSDSNNIYKVRITATDTSNNANEELFEIIITDLNDTIPSSFDITGELYDIGNPTDNEVMLLEYINRARSNPTKEGKFLSVTDDANVESAINYFNVNLTVLKSAFTSYSVAPPLAFNKKLNVSGLSTTTMMKDFDTQSHTIDGVSFQDRINASGYQYYGIGENIYAYSKSAIFAHAGFNIDWGTGTNGMQDPPGHRLSIMGIGRDYREIGISVLTDIPDSLDVGPMIVSQEFGTPQTNTHFITGVVYNDLNGNRFYDLGEGIGGVTISVENGDYYAITTQSGAYTIPFNSSGTVNIQAFGTGFPLDVKSISLGTINYKLDFNMQGNGANGDASVGFDALNLQKKNKANTYDDEIKTPGETVFIFTE